MLGRPMPLDDAFQTGFTPGNETPRMLELRRQRSIRTFMMFLMMLILMDGEEPKNRQMRIKRENLRRAKSLSADNNTMGEDFFKRMRRFDDKLHRVGNAHSRFNKLIQLNGDVDEEARVEKWVMEEIERKTKEGDGLSTEKPKTEKKDNVVDEEATRLVYHYPRNVTGYYRGKWEALDVGRNSTEDPSIKTASSVVGEEVLDNETVKALHDGFMAEVSKREDEIIDKLKERRGDKAESLGVFLLPPEIRLGNEANAAPSDVHNIKDETSLTVTESSGRTVFQLYSRSIPAVREISLIDGFVRLYDVSNEHFAFPRQHLFLRVRGVTIHSIGRLSLVANDKLFRSALFLNDHAEDSSVKEEARAKNANSNPDDEINEKRRRLLGSISDVRDHSHMGYKGEDKKLIDRVRDNALKLYDHYFNVDEVGGKYWNEYADTVEDNPNDAFSLGRETYYSQANITMTEKNVESSSQLNGQSHRHLKNEVHVSNNEMKRNEASSQANATILKGEANGSQIVHNNRLQINETLALDAEIKSSDTDDDQSKLSTRARQLDKETSKENKIPLSIIPHPFVPDDETLSLKKLPSFITKDSPSENHFQHGLNCEFELNLDVKETQWSVGEWRTMSERLMNDVAASDPSTLLDKEATDKSEETVPVPTFELPTKKKRDEALVMNLIGTIESPGCNFASTVNLTAIRTDWEQAQYKAINYSFYMMLACLTQIVLLLRQLLHTQAQSAATKVSMICIGWQAIIDAMLCVGHILLCMMMQPVFTAFAMVAFFKLLIFCVIEKKYMVIIMQARINADNNYSAEDLRRRVASLHLKFYCALVAVLMVFWTLIQSHRVMCLLALYSFWVPQIIQNVITETKNPLHVNYIYGMSLTRLIAPLYMYGVPRNFFMEFFPEYTSDLFVCEMLFLWVGLQAGILIAQGKYGTRFMIPTRFLPPKYDYARPIPESLLPRQHSNERPPSDDVETNTLIGGDDKGPRNRKSSSRNGSDDSHGVTTIYESHDSSEGSSLDCVICYNGINIENKRGYMLAPCDHIFHRDCLEQWMEVKMECPICRMGLPPL